MKSRRCIKRIGKKKSRENMQPLTNVVEDGQAELYDYELPGNGDHSNTLPHPCEMKENNGRDHLKHSKRKSNIREIDNSEEKPLKISKNNLTPEALPPMTAACKPMHTNKLSIKDLSAVRKSQISMAKHDYFGALPDEVLLIMFKFLPKPALVNCSCVCRRWKRIAYDANLWPRIELSQRKLTPGSLGYVLKRGACIVRMSQTEVVSPIFQGVEEVMKNFVSKIEFLDLSMATIDVSDLELLLKTCRNLQKLSLENCVLNESICLEIAKNPRLTVLNMSQCTGYNEFGLKSILTECKKLLELNIAWTSLNASIIKCVCHYVPKGIHRLNLSGCLKEISDIHVGALAIRCNKLKELDLSDATGLTDRSIEAIHCNLKELEILSLSRCYNIYPSSYTKLFILPSLTHLNIFGLFHESQIENLRKSSNIQVNVMRFSNVARPTVGSRRTSIWELRVRE